jgi:hypothetical protein
MLLGKKEDWKNYLSNSAKQILFKILESTRKHRAAYAQADDVKVAQLWSALIELKKEIDEINAKLGKIEAPFRAIVEIGEEEKRKTIERVVSEIIKPTDEETQKATKALVESLMKF